MTVTPSEPAISFDSDFQTDGWSVEQLLVDGDAYFDAILKAIRSADVCIDIEFYIFEDDTLGKRILNELRAAAHRGVRVRLMVDGVGSANFINGKPDRLGRDGIDVRIYHPLPWQMMPRLALPRSLGLRKVLRFFSYLNSRNHRKMVIIDGKTAFVGSLNVSDVHLAEIFGERAWHDAGVRLQGTPVQILGLIFANTWNKAWQSGAGSRTAFDGRMKNVKIDHDSEFVVRNDSRLARHRAYAARIKAIRNARSRIWIATAYFVPNGHLLRALMSAAKRGTDVRILLPRFSDVSFMPLVSRVFYESLTKYGVAVYEYSPRVLHAKMMLVDATAWIGTSNLNHRSLLHDSEIDVILKSAVFGAEVERCFRADFRRSRRIDRFSPSGESVFRRIFVQLLLYFRHLL
ncbi:MAG: hypothetical protein EBR09_15870 [Proteobacteria bacterium]|nr:hypothetical protein [Pseudomonadota bacterium]